MGKFKKMKLIKKFTALVLALVILTTALNVPLLAMYAKIFDIEYLIMEHVEFDAFGEPYLSEQAARRMGMSQNAADSTLATMNQSQRTNFDFIQVEDISNMEYTYVQFGRFFRVFDSLSADGTANTRIYEEFADESRVLVAAFTGVIENSESILKAHMTASTGETKEIATELNLKPTQVSCVNAPTLKNVSFTHTFAITPSATTPWSPWSNPSTPFRHDMQIMSLVLSMLIRAIAEKLNVPQAYDFLNHVAQGVLTRVLSFLPYTESVQTRSRQLDHRHTEIERRRTFRFYSSSNYTGLFSTGTRTTSWIHDWVVWGNAVTLN